MTNQKMASLFDHPIL